MNIEEIITFVRYIRNNCVQSLQVDSNKEWFNIDTNKHYTTEELYEYWKTLKC